MEQHFSGNMEERLWNFIDGVGDAKENSFIEELIATQEAWRSKYQELLGLHQLMQDSFELDEPSMRFSQNVMEEIGRSQIAPAAKTYINKKVIYGIGIFFLVMIAGMFIYGFGQVNWSDAGSASGPLSQYDISKINFGKFFNSSFTNVFMIVNVVMGLMLLDMYLTRKRKRMETGNA